MNGVLFVVALMVFFGAIEGACLRNLDHDGLGEALGRFELAFAFQRELALGFVVIEDAWAVLCALVDELTVVCGGVDVSPKDL